MSTTELVDLELHKYPYSQQIAIVLCHVIDPPSMMDSGDIVLNRYECFPDHPDYVPFSVTFSLHVHPIDYEAVLEAVSRCIWIRAEACVMDDDVPPGQFTFILKSGERRQGTLPVATQ